MGFSRFPGRNAWQKHALTTDVIVFPSMSRYIADGVGCTTFSFGGEVGAQPIFHAYGRKKASDRPDVWFVLEDGSNLDDVVDDALAALREQAIPFIDRLNHPTQALVSLETEDSSTADFGTLGLMSGGSLGSPLRQQTAALIRPLVR